MGLHCEAEAAGERQRRSSDGAKEGTHVWMEKNRMA